MRNKKYIFFQGKLFLVITDPQMSILTRWKNMIEMDQLADNAFFELQILLSESLQ